jgi:MFS family permease
MLHLLRRPLFRRLWIAHAVSAAGTGMSLLVIPIYLLKHFGAAAIGLSLATQTLVRLLGMPYVGVLADRLKRSLIIRIGYATSAAGMTALVASPRVGLWLAIVSAAFLGAGIALVTPTLRAMLPDAVPLESLEAAQGLLNVTWNVAWLVGPALAGIAVTAIDLRAILLLDLASYLVGAVLVPSVWETKAAGEDLPEAAGLRNAARAVRRVPWVATGMLQTATQILFGFGPSLVLILVVSERRYGGQALGIVLSVAAASRLAGIALAVRWRPARPGLVANVGFMTYVVMEPCIAFFVPLPVFLLVLFGTGAAISLHDVWWYAALNSRFPAHMRGRINALDLTVTGSVEPVAMALAVPLAHAVGLGAVCFVGAVAFLVVPLVALAVPGLARYTDPELPAVQPEPALGSAANLGR